MSVVMVNDWMPELAHQRWKAVERRAAVSAYRLRTRDELVSTMRVRPRLGVLEREQAGIGELVLAGVDDPQRDGVVPACGASPGRDRLLADEIADDHDHRTPRRPSHPARPTLNLVLGEVVGVATRRAPPGKDDGLRPPVAARPRSDR